MNRRTLQRHALSRLTTVGRQVVPWRVRGELVRLVKRSSRRLVNPLVTVVVTTQDSEGWVLRCLSSVARQRYPRLEIVVADAGSADQTLDAVRAMAATSRRPIRVVARPDRGVGAARNAGARLARGRYLLFLDAEDVLPRSAVRTLVRTLQRTGSDFAVGRAKRSAGGKLTDPHWAVQVHEVERLRTDLDSFPLAMRDLLLGDRLFRRDFWERNGLSFPDTAPHPGATLAAAYVSARQFDVLDAVTLHWAPSAGDGLLGTRVLDAEEAAAFVADIRAATAQIDRGGSPTMRAAWTARVVDVDLEPRLRACVDADEHTRALIAGLAAEFVERADDDVLDDVRFAVKLLAWLAAEDRWDDVERAVEYLGLHGRTPPTHVADGVVLADVADDDEGLLPADLPPAVRRLARSETELAAMLQRVRWRDDVLELTGWALVHGVDMTGVVPELTVELVDATTGDRLPMEVEHEVLAQATRWGSDSYQRYDTGGFTARLRPQPDALLGEVPQTERVWRLEVTLSVAGVTRTGVVRHLVTAGSPGVLRAKDVDGLLVAPVMSPLHGMTLRVRRPAVRAVALAAEGTTVTVRLRTEGVRVERLRLWAGGGRRRVEVPVRAGVDGVLTARVTVPERRLGRRNQIWQVRAVADDGSTRRVAWDVGSGLRTLGTSAPGQLVWRGTPRGHLEVVANHSVFEVVDVRQEDEQLVVVVSRAGAPEPTAASFTSHRVTVPAAELRADGDRTELRFPLRISRWGRDPRCWPGGLYQLSVETEEGTRRPWPAWPFLDHLPEEVDGPDCILRYGRQSPGVLTVRVRPPLTDEEWGRTAQRRLQRAYRERTAQPEDAVLFQCYRGEVATDSQLALHEELHRRGAPLTLYWGVRDHSVSLPEGAVPVLIQSQRWYELLADARYLSNNVDFPKWFTRREHQVFVQTFHGYPFKSMGISFWREQGRNERDIARETARREQAWSVALVPADFCQELYRREYAFGGEIMVSGYPRDDVLVSDRADAVRQRTRELLGIAPHQQAVLYAPTWRESISADTWNAPLFDALDIDRLAVELGSDHVVLLRGHNHNLGEQARFTDHATVIDVTDHPEINDLILASDAAVLDYSSLRFDYALTGRPMLFFVPDLEDYVKNRSFLFDYEPTAPGPWLRTTDEVVTALRDLDRVREDHADARRAFHERFNLLNDGSAAARVIDAWIPEGRVAQAALTAGGAAGGPTDPMA
ncbi:CDP-glycerol glycerophosphotransferase family protein [Geodermatophilus sp. SYSU D00965]